MNEKQIEHFIVWDVSVRSDEDPDKAPIEDLKKPQKYSDIPNETQMFYYAAGQTTHVNEKMKTYWETQNLKLKCILNIETCNAKHLKRCLDEIFYSWIPSEKEPSAITQTGIQFNDSIMRILPGLSFKEFNEVALQLGHYLNNEYENFTKFSELQSELFKKRLENERNQQEKRELEERNKTQREQIEALKKQLQELQLAQPNNE